MNRRRRGTLALAVACVTAGCGGPSFAEAVPALAQPQTEQDRSPAPGDGAGVDAGSTRYLGGTQVAEYWVGLDGDEICLVQSLRGTATVGAGCTDAGGFERSGVQVSTSSPGASATGLLFPAGFDLAAAGGEWVVVSDNLAAPADEGEPQTPPG